MTNENILIEVAEERDYQIQLYGVQRHDLTVWMTVLGEEFGEACKAILELRQIPRLFHERYWVERTKPKLQELRRELIQIAAVAVAAIEQMDDEVLRDGY